MVLVQQLTAGERMVPAGLLHFSSRPLRLPVARPLSWIRIYLPGRGQLALSGLELPGMDRAQLAAAQISWSGAGEEPSTATGFNPLQPIRTTESIQPFWQIHLPQATEVTEIVIHNRHDRLAYQNNQLCCDFGDDGGGTWRFCNADRAAVVGRLGALAVALQQFGDRARVLVTDRKSPAALRARNLDAATAAMLSFDPFAATLDAPRRKTVATLVDAVLAVIKGAEGRILERLVADAAPVLDALLDRSSRPANLLISDAECRAVATVLAAEFLASGAVARPAINENDVFLRNKGNVAAIEEEIDRLYVAATGDRSISPIMFRSHGISGSDLIANAGAYIASMKEVEAKFAELGYQTAICYGTLLGAVRSGAFIPHDDDVDMVMLLKSTQTADLASELKAIVRDLEAAGWSALIRKQLFIKTWAPIAGKEVDIFPIIDGGGETVSMHMESLRIRPVPRGAVLPLNPMSFYGQPFLGPADPEAFLAERYGETWRTPMRQAAMKATAA